jgi:ATP adenylyltransferase
MFSESSDRKNLILYRGTRCAVVMNRFPYTSGHLMVTPFRHIADPGQMTEPETVELHRLTVRSIDVLKKVMNPQGFNIGINLGESAGAGLKDHLHQHLVPRWTGDTNFMPVLGGPRVMPEALLNTYDLLSKEFCA